MPLCYLRTNMKRSEFPEDTEERMANCIVEAFGAPLELQHVFVMMQCELPAFMGGSRDPAVVCEIVAKTYFQNDEGVKAYFPKFFETLKEITKLPGNRLVVHLVHVADNLADIGS